MELIPDDIRAHLLANGAAEEEMDYIPVVKFFDPCGRGTWIITEMMDDGDSLLGLCDLGFPELGYASLTEIQSVTNRLGLSIQRDLDFRPCFPLSVYTEAARLTGSIIGAEQVIDAVAASMGTPPMPRDDVIAEWMGLHYGRNFDAESEPAKASWRARYVASHRRD
ncbi:DUF2958 domain-containing protein [Acidocella facilis]|uniref:DUF2958 domain-containing protein n=1 Tax=Acidocella facilis TaxID=525 RepID=UPI001F37C3F6|nr:DUF2958 domain-containing protein [Acidocella facilis]